jgi:cytoskeletal protein CcmA (bactofilin family)
MARRSHDDALGVVGAETVIGTGVVVRGNLSSESDIVIDGTLEGNVKAGGNVTIGVNASVKGDIEATNATVAGALRGNITVEGEASILETGQVRGNIKSAGLAITSGGIFIGRSLMESAPHLLPEAEAEESDSKPETEPEA